VKGARIKAKINLNEEGYDTTKICFQYSKLKYAFERILIHKAQDGGLIEN